MATKFKPEEIRTNGKAYATYGLYGGAPYSVIEYMNSPITPKENFKRFFYRRKDYEWIPDSYSDYYEITPDTNPDNHAMGYEGGIDAFGVKWEPLENGLPALVRPGNPKLKNIEDWENLIIPDPETFGLRKDAINYLATADRNRPLRCWINIALFERLIDVMGFEAAAEALITNPDEVKAFLAKITEYNIRLIDIYIESYQADIIALSDDWSSQRSPFFSEKTAREIFLPFLKQMADHVHAHGLPFMMHSCGNGIAHIPIFIEAGVDAWQFQENAIDLHKAIDMAEGKLILEGYWVLPMGLDEEGQGAYMEHIIQEYCGNGCTTIAFCDADYMVSPFIRKKAYELGRIYASK